jgi:hypothetical protein
MAESIRYIKADPIKWSKVVGFEPTEITCLSCGKRMPVDVPIIINNDYVGYEMKAHGALNECVDLPTTTTTLRISPEDLEKIIQDLQH